MTTAAGRGNVPDWIGLGEASQLLGIAPGTLRRWADDGRVPVFTTPGGHRRFSRATLRAFLPSNRARRPSLARLGASTERIARAYHPVSGGRGGSESRWIEAIPEKDRADFRERGRRLVTILLEILDAADRDVADLKLQEASRLAAEHGRHSAALGATMGEAVAGFLQFRAPFVTELAAIGRRRGLDTREAMALIADAEAAIDRLLLAMVTGHSLASGPPTRGGGRRLSGEAALPGGGS